MQNLNNIKCDPIKQQQRVVAGRIHLAFCAELYQMQLSAGRYYLHEHPLTASSWKEKCIDRIAAQSFVTQIHMCAYGMKIPDKMAMSLFINLHNLSLIHRS